MARDPVRLFLSEHEGDARPDTLAYPRVRDLDAVAAEFGTPVIETARDSEEIELRDPDGNRRRVASVEEDDDGA